MEVRIRAIRSLASICAGLGLLGGVMASPAAADSVRAPFHVTVNSTFGDLTALGAGPLFGVGDRFTAALVYDTNATIVQHDFNFAQYKTSGSISLRLGYGIAVPLEGIIVVERYFVNNILQQAFVGTFGSTESFPGFDSIQMELEFRGGDRTGVALPQSAAELFNHYDNGGFFRLKAWQTGVEAPFDMGTQEFTGTVNPVPEPGTLLLVGAGAAMLMRRLRGRATCD